MADTSHSSPFFHRDYKHSKTQEECVKIHGFSTSFLRSWGRCGGGVGSALTTTASQPATPLPQFSVLPSVTPWVSSLGCAVLRGVNSKGPQSPWNTPKHYLLYEGGNFTIRTSLDVLLCASLWPFRIRQKSHSLKSTLIKTTESSNSKWGRNKEEEKKEEGGERMWRGNRVILS